MLREIPRKIVEYGRVLALGILLNSGCGTGILYRTADAQPEVKPETLTELTMRVSRRDGGKLGDICTEPMRTEWTTGYVETDTHYIATACTQIRSRTGMHMDIARMNAASILASCKGNTHRQGIDERSQGPEGSRRRTYQKERASDTQTGVRYDDAIIGSIDNGMQCVRAFEQKPYQ